MRSTALLLTILLFFLASAQADDSEFSPEYLRAKEILREKWLAKESIRLDDDEDEDDDDDEEDIQARLDAFNAQKQLVKAGTSPINHLFDQYESKLSPLSLIANCTDITTLTNLHSANITTLAEQIEDDKKNIKLIMKYAKKVKKSITKDSNDNVGKVQMYDDFILL